MAGSSSRADLGRAARQRLHLLGLSDAQIASIEKNAAPSENVTIPSPASGFVIEKNVVEGASIDPGMRLFRIAALNKVWVEADVYEGDLRHVRVGQTATVTLDFLPGRSYEAKVSYIYPFLDPKNRTVRVRTELANKDLDLRPGMYATIELAADPEPRLQVPASAVVYTGPRRIVFLDLGEGRFRPQEVRVGSQANGMYEVLEGLHAGDIVATSGVFLIAAEARIRTATKYWDDTEPSSAPSAPAPGSPAPAAPSPRAPADFPKAPSRPAMPSPQKTEPAKPTPPATVYTCPMHPEIRSPTPGKCPICGMDLVPAPGGAPR
jgi:Cu(I)/Ag(I) efflux system membrane fusion protein